MIKITRPEKPQIKVYKVRKSNLTDDERTEVLGLIDNNSIGFTEIIPRLKDKNARFTKAEKETLKSILFYANTKHFKDNKKLTKKKAPNFSVYKDDELKIILRELFNKKCAYCESKFLAVSPADIEHFRPKGAINPFTRNKDEDLIYPGYYWLAADWENLLWSCISCNRKSNLESAVDMKTQPLGKQNRFPVADEDKRIRSHNDDIRPEHLNKLILDPCVDDPSKHLQFPVKGKDLGIVKSAILENGQISEKGEASIPVYGLNRVELVFARREEALDLQAIFIGMLRSLEAFIRKNEMGEDASAEEGDFLLQKRRFNVKLSKSAPYLALKSQLLKDFNEFELIKKLNLKVEQLVDQA